MNNMSQHFLNSPKQSQNRKSDKRWVQCQTKKEKKTTRFGQHTYMDEFWNDEFHTRLLVVVIVTDRQ